MWPFFYLQYGVSSSRATADLSAGVSERISRLFNRSRTTRAIASNIQAFDGVWHVGLLDKLRSYGISGRVNFSVTGSFVWFSVESLQKNVQLMRAFLKAPFLVHHFFLYTLMTLMMLSVIFLPVPMILLSTQSVARHMICDNSEKWLLNLNLTYETLWSGARSGFLIFWFQCWKNLTRENKWV